MKYGRRIVREAIDKFPYKEGATRKDLLLVIKSIKPNKEGIFGQHRNWRVKIHFVLSYIKISYFPNWPSLKGRIYFRQVKEDGK
jgi:hypothetical protein